jgi:hypothetical protein
MQHLSDSDELCAGVRQIEIPYVSETYKNPRSRARKLHDAQYDRLVKLIPKMTQLGIFVYGAVPAIPSLLVDCLSSHSPGCRLYILSSGQTYIRSSGRLDNPDTISQFRGSPCLYSLNVSFWHTDHRTFEELQEVVSSTPNLRELYVKSIGPDEINTFMAKPLRFRGCGRSALNLHRLGLIGFTLANEDGGWVNHADWSVLTHLAFSDFTFIPVLAPRLTGLRSLHVELGVSYRLGSRDNPVLNGFLGECKLLEELDLRGYTATLDRSVFTNLGRTLKILRIHEDVASGGLHRRTVLSPNDLQIIGETCPHLYILGVDLAYEGEECDGNWVRFCNF